MSFWGKHGVLDLQHSQAKGMSLGLKAVVIIEKAFILGVNSDSITISLICIGNGKRESSFTEVLEL